MLYTYSYIHIYMYTYIRVFIYTYTYMHIYISLSLTRIILLQGPVRPRLAHFNSSWSCSASSAAPSANRPRSAPCSMRYDVDTYLRRGIFPNLGLTRGMFSLSFEITVSSVYSGEPWASSAAPSASRHRSAPCSMRYIFFCLVYLE